MSAQRMTTTRDRIEQRLAHGDLPEEIATRLGAPLGEVLRIGEQMDAAARHVDDPRNDPPPPPTCSQGHHLTPDNLAPRGDTRRECRACKQKRDRARAKKVAA